MAIKGQALTGLDSAQKLEAKNLHRQCDSQLIVNQVKGDYTEKEPNMIAYMVKTNLKLDTFSWFEILQIWREKNFEADTLARFRSSIDEEELGTVPIKSLYGPSVSRDEVRVIEVTPQPSWMGPITKFLRRWPLSKDRTEGDGLRALRRCSNSSTKPSPPRFSTKSTKEFVGTTQRDTPLSLNLSIKAIYVRP